jgi:hypothetical protein
MRYKTQDDWAKAASDQLERNARLITWFEQCSEEREQLVQARANRIDAFFTSFRKDNPPQRS